MTRKPVPALISFTLDLLVAVLFAAEKRVKVLKEIRRSLGGVDDLCTESVCLEARSPLLAMMTIVDARLKSARADVLIAEHWMVGAQEALEYAARRYVDAALADQPPTALDVWTLGWAGDEDLPPRQDYLPFTPAESDFLAAVAPHIGKTLEMSEVVEALVVLRAAKVGEAAEKPARAA